MVPDSEIEQVIQAKGLTGPRITPDDIEGKIVKARYHVFPGTTLTVCALELENGYVVTGHSACASPGNFDAELGRRLACDHARRQIWALEGYLLRERLHRG